MSLLELAGRVALGAGHGAARELPFSRAFVGVTYALIATMFSSTANVLIKVSHFPASKPYYKRLWAVILIFYASNATMDFMSYAYAPISLVAPVSALTIAINAVLAYYVLGERLSMQDKIGSFLIMAGAAGAVSLGTRQAPDRTVKDLEDYFVRPTFLVFVCVNFSCLAFIFFLERQLRPQTLEIRHAAEAQGGRVDCAVLHDQLPQSAQKKHRMHAVVYGLMTAMVSSWTNLLAKALVELITQEKRRMWREPQMYFLLAGVATAGTCQLTLTADMLKQFEAVLIVPIFHCFFILMLITYGNFYFIEFENVAAVRIVMFGACLCVSFLGVYLLSQRAPHYTEVPRRFSTASPEEAASAGGRIGFGAGDDENAGNDGEDNYDNGRKVDIQDEEHERSALLNDKRD